MARALVDLLLPPRCPACAQPAAAVWCSPCLGELASLALAGRGDVLLAPGVRAVGAYRYAGVVRDTMLAVKVAGRHAALEGMGALMRTRLDLPRAGQGCAVTWVPTSRRRIRDRGADAPRVLAGPHAVPLLRRVRDTRDQTELSPAERRRNPAGAFAAVSAVPPAVVLVDDVRTTGATALAGAQALLVAGARRVLVATFAVAAEPDQGDGGRSPGAGAVGRSVPRRSSWETT